MGDEPHYTKMQEADMHKKCKVRTISIQNSNNSHNSTVIDNDNSKRIEITQK